MLVVENDQNYPPLVANWNQRKLGESEKIVKKKVLTERNEATDLKFSENPSSEVANVDLKPSSCKEDSETKLLYDPLTNYLSPRPRFLRYKPSRRREIFRRRVGEENSEIGEGFLRTVGEDSLLVSHNSSSEEEQTEMQEKEKLEEESEGKSTAIDEEIEDEDEGDEKRGRTVKELLKVLLVIASLVLCTAYITSRNTPTPSFEVSGAFRSGLCPILNHTGGFGSSIVVESLNVNGSNFWDEQVTEAASSNMNSEGVNQFVHHEDESNIGYTEETEILNGENEGKATYGDSDKLGYNEAEEMAEGTIDEEKAEDEENGVEFSELTAEDDDDDQQNGKEFEISNAIAEDDEDQQDELIVALKPSIVNGLDEDNFLFDILTPAGNENTSQMGAVEKDEAGDWEIIESNTREAESFMLEVSKITILERITEGISSFVEDLEKLKSELIELMRTETESVLKAVLGLSVSSAILTSLVLSFQYKKKKDDKKDPAISVSVEPLLQSPVAKAEKVLTRESPSIKPTCDVDRSSNEPIRIVDSFKTLSSSIHSRDEVESLKEFYHHEAPTVQFLGEFNVGEISNSLKNRKIEAEDSNFHVSVEERPVSKNMNSGPEQALSEFSTTSSPSYGSFTTKKKIVKKEVRIILKF